jgi:hypothetical protein
MAENRLDKNTCHARPKSAGTIEGRGGVGLVFARMQARIKTTAPFPRIGAMLIADALGNRADMNIKCASIADDVPIGGG